MDDPIEFATFGAGCFWCTEAVFQAIRGVEKVIPGYAGGHVPNPTYDQVCSGTTGHIEVARITFNPKSIGYEQLVEIFFGTHNPTTKNRQGNDIGEQYQSAIFYHSNEQKEIAEKVKTRIEAEKIYTAPVVTQIRPFVEFFEAEEYHKAYYAKHPSELYCQTIINPKIAKLRKSFSHFLK